MVGLLPSNGRTVYRFSKKKPEKEEELMFSGGDEDLNCDMPEDEEDFREDSPRDNMALRPWSIQSRRMSSGLRF